MIVNSCYQGLDVASLTDEAFANVFSIPEFREYLRAIGIDPRFAKDAGFARELSGDLFFAYEAQQRWIAWRTAVIKTLDLIDTSQGAR